MVRGSTEPWAATLAASSPEQQASEVAPVSMSSGSLPWQSSTCRELAITQPARPASPLCRPHGSRGKRKQERQGYLLAGLPHTPGSPAGQAGARAWAPFLLSTPKMPKSQM